MARSFLSSLLLALALVAGAWAADPSQPHYLDAASLDVSTLLPAPPAPDSPAANQDIQEVLKIQETTTAADLARAKKDEKRDPVAFSGVLGSWFTEQNLPVTFRVLNKAEKESQSISEKVKRVWNRPRPPLQDERIHPTINLPSTASYPSGHALQGMEWALLLSELAPDQKEQIMQRGRDFGNSRLIGGVHFPTDVKAGQILGEKLFAKLMESEVFREDFALARKEFDAVRSQRAAASATSLPTAPASGRLADRVIVIGLDGCRPEAIQQAAGPVLRDLYEKGAVSWKASAVLPTVTQVNFASILTGCLPEKHGITSVKWQPGDADRHVNVPTIFQYLAKEKLTSAAFLGHEKLYPSESPGEGSYFERSPGSARGAARSFLKYLATNKPDFAFIYMGNLDGAGHKHGWLSPEQLAEMPGIDAAISDIVEGLKQAGLWDGTLLMITSDHGGHGRSHSEGTPEDCLVPLICHGPGVKPGYEIQKPVHNFDVAATALYALGIPVPAGMDAQPITEIFVGKTVGSSAR